MAEGQEMTFFCLFVVLHHVLQSSFPLCLCGMPRGLFLNKLFLIYLFFQSFSSIQKGPASLCLCVAAQTFAHVRAILTLQLLYFLAQLCLGDLFNDKCSRWELARPLMICHVTGGG